MLERLQKVLAKAGVAARRKAEAMIAAGRVRVDGRLVKRLGTKVDPERATITVDGQPINFAPPVVYLLNKPSGVVTTTSDEHGRRTVLDLVPSKIRLFPVGRLDRMTEGLLLLTNDGTLADQLTHPRYKIDKEYEVTGVAKKPVAAIIDTLRSGMNLKDGWIKPDQVSLAGMRKGQMIIAITLHEGRSHLIRRLAVAAGLEITRLRRIRIGPLTLGAVPLGRFRALDQSEIDQLLPARSAG